MSYKSNKFYIMSYKFNLANDYSQRRWKCSNILLFSLYLHFFIVRFGLDWWCFQFSWDFVWLSNWDLFIFEFTDYLPYRLCIRKLWLCGLKKVWSLVLEHVIDQLVASIICGYSDCFVFYAHIFSFLFFFLVFLARFLFPLLFCFGLC